MSKTCSYCNGNNKDAPCAFPGEKKDGCLKLEEAFDNLENLFEKVKSNMTLEMTVIIQKNGTIRNVRGWRIGKMTGDISFENLQDIEAEFSSAAISKKESEPFHKVPDELDELKEYGYIRNDWDTD